MPDSDILHLKDLTLGKVCGAKAAHGFFGRTGGVSEGLYSSLNCGPGSSDAVEHVQENRRRVARILGTGAEDLLSLYQVHGKTCLYVQQGWSSERPQADAFITDVPGLALGVLTADCAPVLFYGETQDGAPVIGAAHAGWRGAVGGVLEETVTAFGVRGVAADAITAAIGPCIGRISYEVSAAFIENFIQQDEAYERFFAPGAREGQGLFDLAGFAAARLAAAGVQRVGITDADTFARENDFFSYRRTTHRKEGDYGRQISAIVICAA